MLSALYALDPVGTSGTTFRTPSTIFGFHSNHFAGAAARARAVLMLKESRIEPNIYTDTRPELLKQVRIVMWLI
jgi:hypothetical protein